MAFRFNTDAALARARGEPDADKFSAFSNFSRLALPRHAPADGALPPPTPAKVANIAKLDRLAPPAAIDKHQSASKQDRTPAAVSANAFDPAEIEERAAIARFEAGVPAAWCEGWARLQLMAPPAGFTAPEWSAFLDTCGVLLDRHGRELRRLGWTARELFGLDPHAPGQLDPSALAFALARAPDAAVIACGRESAVIETPTGARQRHWRTVARQT